MKRRYFSQHFMPSLSLDEPVLLSSEMQSHLVAWADTERDAVRFRLEGPSFVYRRKGKELTTKVFMTVALSDGREGYWDAAKTDFESEPEWLQVKKAHAALRGADYFVLTPAYIEANLVEHTNRLSLFYLQLSAAGFDSTAVETQVLMAIHDRQATLGELAIEIGVSAGKMKVAAFRLWKRHLVELPVSSQLLSDAWSIRGAANGLR